MPTERKDLELHNLQGTKPEYMSEPEFASGRPKMPKDLPPLAIEEWKRLVPKLCKRKTLTKADASSLDIYCRMYSRYREVEALAQGHQVVQTSWLDKNGNEHFKDEESVASKIARSLESQMRAYLVQFSATPASRKQTKPDTKSKPDPSKADLALLSRDNPQPARPDEEPDLDAILALADDPAPVTLPGDVEGN